MKKLEKQEAKLRVRHTIMCDMELCYSYAIGEDREAFTQGFVRRIQTAGPAQEAGASESSSVYMHILTRGLASNHTKRCS